MRMLWQFLSHLVYNVPNWTIFSTCCHVMLFVSVAAKYWFWYTLCYW